MNGSAITLFKVDSLEIVGRIEQENEEVITFAISPNQQWLAATNKNYSVKVYRVPTELPESLDKWIMPECVHTLRIPNQLGVEICFDPMSRFLAVGTADSHIKVFDITKGF